MFAQHAFAIRSVTPADHGAVRRLCALDSTTVLSGPMLIGEIDGAPAAVITVHGERVAADPFQHTAKLVAHLRLRAGVLRAHERTPSLIERMRAWVRTPGITPWRA